MDTCPGHGDRLVPAGEPEEWSMAWPGEDIAGWGWCPSCQAWWKPGAEPGRVSYRRAETRVG